MNIVGKVALVFGTIVVSMFRLAVGIVVSFIAPIAMPILVLLSGGSLLVASGFACIGHWQDALKGLWACFVCSLMLAAFAGLVQLVAPYVFSLPVVVTNRRKGGR
jgi:hypothetical protein